MSAPWQPPSPKLSALAKKYNHPVGGRHDDLYGSTELKSGLTPLNLGPFERYEDVHNLQRWKTYQRERFEGKCLPPYFSTILYLYINPIIRKP
jgi:hypothetical protein